MRLRVLPILAVLAWPVAPAVAAPQPQDVTIQAERLNKKALEDYDNLEFDSARQTLLSVIGKLRDAGLDETPIAATTYVNLGTVYIAGFKDRNRGVQQFVNALKIDPQMHLDAERATPELQEAFEEAQKQAGARPKVPAADNANVPAKTLQHTPVDEARTGQKVSIKAQLGAGLPVQRIFLFYRAAGQEEYVSVPMEESGKEWSAEIPGEAVTGKALHYYLDARDGKGQPVIGSGSSSSPHIISLSSPTGVDHDNPLGKTPKEKARGWGRVYLGATIGTGLGIAMRGNRTEVAYQQGPEELVPQNVGTTGLVSAPLHLNAELGVQVVRAFSISAVGRFQVYTGANADGSVQGGGTGTRKATGAVAGLLRLRYRFDLGKAMPYLQINGGYGYIRHMLDITSSQSGAQNPLVDINGNPVCPDSTQKCVDSVAMGSVLIGGGVGIWYDVTRFDNGGFGLIAELNVLAGFGTQTGVNFDLNLGIGAHFL